MITHRSLGRISLGPWNRKILVRSGSLCLRSVMVRGTYGVTYWRNWLKKISQTYPFWEFNLRLFESNWRGKISQNYPFWCFQPSKPQKKVGLRNWWEKISQTHPFLKVSALKISKKGRFEKLGFSGIRTLYPLARTNALSVRQRGPNSNERPPFSTKCTGNVVVWRNKDFSNLPLFEGFSPENLKKG